MGVNGDGHSSSAHQSLCVVIKHHGTHPGLPEVLLPQRPPPGIGITQLITIGTQLVARPGFQGGNRKASSHEMADNYPA